MRARRSLSLVTGPAAEPLTLGEVKSWAKIDGTDDDALLASLLTSAIEAAEEWTKRRFISQTWKLTLDQQRSGCIDLPDGVYDAPVSILHGGLPRVIELPFPPLQSITSVVTYDTDGDSSTYSSSNYQVDSAGGRVVLKETAVWPSPLRPVAACEVTFVCGYGATSTFVPEPIKAAIKMHVQHMYDGRIVCDMPPQCQSLLRLYKVFRGA